jgi:hypothetical protein
MLRKTPLIWRRLLATACGLVAVFVALLGLTLSPISTRHTIENARKIELAFHRAIPFVEAHRRASGAFPSDDELARLSEQEGTFYHVEVVAPKYDSWDECCREAVKNVGMPPKGGYILQVWRGEWFEYYAPWPGKSTLTFNANDFALSGNVYVDLLLETSVALALSFITLRLWRRPSP